MKVAVVRITPSSAINPFTHHQEAHNAEGFDYRMARWLPFQDQEACRKARAIKREDITRHPNPDFEIQIIDFRWW